MRSADMVLFFGTFTTFCWPPFTLAHRALWAAAILALPEADIPPRGAAPFPYAVPKAESAAPIAFISLVNRSCSFFNICTTPSRFVIESPSREFYRRRWAMSQRTSPRRLAQLQMGRYGSKHSSEPLRG